MLDPRRGLELNEGYTDKEARYVLYWMQQGQRGGRNDALEEAVRRANALRLPVLVLFVLIDDFPEANLRHYRFMLEGLLDSAEELARRGVGFLIRRSDSMVDSVLDFASSAALVVTDRGYLRVQRQWRAELARRLKRLLIQVESDVVVPVELAYPKEAYSAAVLRPKIHQQLQSFLRPVEEERVNHRIDKVGICRAEKEQLPLLLSGDLSKSWGAKLEPIHRQSIADLEGELQVDRSVPPVDWLRGGRRAALDRLEDFVQGELRHFDQRRNDPGRDSLSHMSGYLHFGHISPVEIALRVSETGLPAADVYMEELIVRRELAMNFVFYNTDYQEFQGLPEWARRTLGEHELDRREYLYGPEELERAQTHDPYWNAAQRELLIRGKMHGYMRMYWGKKILEWSPDVRSAFEISLYLNNRYSLDGRDPNGFAGVAWCFGKHDRPWAERPIFGKVRYMNSRGLERKFDMQSYIDRIAALG